MEQHTHSAPSQGRLSTWIDKSQGDWSGAFTDERQEAIWNKAAASAMYLMMWVSVIAALGFMTVDAERYSSSAFVLCLIAVGGPAYARAAARRQKVTPVSRIPSWPSTAVSALLFGTLFFVMTRAMDHEQDWQTRAIASAVLAVAWAVVLRLILQRRHHSVAGPSSSASGGRV